MACKFAFKGLDVASNEAGHLLYEYNQRKVLAKLGARFDLEELNVFEVEAFTIIASEFNRLENLELKSKSSSRKR